MTTGMKKNGRRPEHVLFARQVWTGNGPEDVRISTLRRGREEPEIEVRLICRGADGRPIPWPDATRIPVSSALQVASAVRAAAQLGLATSEGHIAQGDRPLLFYEEHYTTIPGELLAVELRADECGVTLELERRRGVVRLERGVVRELDPLGDTITMPPMRGLEFAEALLGAFYIGFDLPRLDPGVRRCPCASASPARPP